MSTQTIHCTVLTSHEGDASRPWPRYRKISPWSDPLIAKWLVARVGDQGVSVITATETRPAKTTVGKMRLLQPNCELPPPLDDTSIDSWRVVPRHSDEIVKDVSNAASHGADNAIEDKIEDDAE